MDFLLIPIVALLMFAVPLGTGVLFLEWLQETEVKTKRNKKNTKKHNQDRYY